MKDTFILALYKPVDMKMEVTTQANSDSSGEPAHAHSLTRATAARKHTSWNMVKIRTKKSRYLVSLDCCACVFKGVTLLYSTLARNKGHITFTAGKYA